MKLYTLLSLALAGNLALISANPAQTTQDKAQFDVVGLQSYMQAIVAVQQQCSQKNNVAECKKALGVMNCVILYYCDALKGTRSPGALDKSFQDKQVQAENDVELQTRMKALPSKASELFIKYSNSL